MTAQTIGKGDWQAFCATVSKALEGSNAEIEVASLDLGDQIEAEWSPWIGITYDPEDDVFDIALEETDHVVSAPKTLVADVDDMEINTLQITDGEGRMHLVRLRDALLLAPH